MPVKTTKTKKKAPAKKKPVKKAVKKVTKKPIKKRVVKKVAAKPVVKKVAKKTSVKKVVAKKTPIKKMAIVHNVQEPVKMVPNICRSCNALPAGTVELVSLLLVTVFSLSAVLLTSVYAMGTQSDQITQLESQLNK